jgi:hypothetical protein
LFEVFRGGGKWRGGGKPGGFDLILKTGIEGVLDKTIMGAMSGLVMG